LTLEPAAEPRPPHPNFWWALLWCIGFLFVVLVASLAASVIVLVIIMFAAPHLLPLQDASNIRVLMQSQGWSIIMAVAMFVDKSVEIVVAVLVLRLIVGRDWKRQIAIRGPSG